MGQEQRNVCFDSDLGIEAYSFRGIMQKFPNHFHEYYVIGFVENGERRLSSKNVEYIIRPGDIVLFNPMDNHTCEQVGDNTLDYRCLNIKPDIMRKTVADITGTYYLPAFTRSVIFQSEHVSMLRDLHKMIMSEQKAFLKEETFLFLIEWLVTNYSQPYEGTAAGHASSEIDAVCSYLETHFAGHVSLDDLEKISGINKFSLLRSFTRIKGITPYRYLETVRINHAKKLLEEGVEPIEAAMRTGFVDQSHFTNFFKEFIGLTPKQYQIIFTGDK